MEFSRRNQILLSTYTDNADEIDARWVAGGGPGLLCDQPLNIVLGYVLSFMIDTDAEKRLRICAWLDDKVVETDDDGSMRVVEKVDLADIDPMFADMGEPPAWWGSGKIDAAKYGSLRAGDEIQQ